MKNLPLKLLLIITLLSSNAANAFDFHDLLPKKRKPKSFISEMQSTDLATLNATAAHYSKEGDNKRAVDIYESIRAIYPFTTDAEEAMYKLMHIYHKVGYKKSSELILVTEDYIGSFPNGKYLEEANYLRCEGYSSKMNRVRDKHLIEDTVEVLEEYNEEFGKSGQHKDQAQKRLMEARGKLVFRELEIGNFYEKKKNYTPALVRYVDALRIAGENVYTPEILYRIYFCYKGLGLHADAEVYFKKLKNEYPTSKWFSYALGLEK